MRFPYPTDIHPKCRGFLERSAAHIATLTPKQRAAWLREWIPAAADFPLDGGIRPSDLLAVTTTLNSWQDELAKVSA